MTVIDFEEYAKLPKKTRERTVDGLRRHRRQAEGRRWIYSPKKKNVLLRDDDEKVDFECDLSEVD